MMSREISCPRCGKPSLFTPENLYRPFCSERCKLIDLGNWADGRYAIPLGGAEQACPEQSSDDELDEKLSMKNVADDADSGTESDFDDDDRHRH